MPWISELLTSTLLLMTTATVETTTRIPEYRLKAQFISVLPQYVKWPSAADPKVNKQPITIGILGDSPFELYLVEALRDQSGVRGKIQQFRHVQHVDNCQVLFICSSERERLTEILQKLNNRPILTICDFNNGARDGVMVNLILINQKIRMEFNRSAAKSHGMDFSSSILKLAQNIY